MTKKEILNDTEILQGVYGFLKTTFKDLDKKNWVQVDFFNNKDDGYKHFLNEIKRDDSLVFPTHGNKQDHFYDIIQDLGEQIYEQLAENLAISQLEQS